MPAWLQQVILAVAGVLLLQFILFVRWFWRRMMDDVINRKFIKDMAVNHLPYIYECLKQIGELNGVQIPTPPAVQWVDINNGNGHKPSWHQMT